MRNPPRSATAARTPAESATWGDAERVPRPASTGMATHLRLDLHTHAKVAKRTAYNPADIERFADAAERRGLHGYAITEHAHASEFWRIYEDLRERFAYTRGRFEIGALRVYPGMEVTLAERADIAVIAPLDDLRRLDESFETPLTAGRHPSALEFVDRLGSLDTRTLRIIAHPTRDDKPAHGVPEPMLAAIADAVEVNARHAGFDAVSRTRALADRLGVPLVGGSDAHAWPQVGASSTLIAAEDDSFDAVRSAVLGGRCRPIVHDDAERLVAAGRALKERIKSREPRLAPLAKRPENAEA